MTYEGEMISPFCRIRNWGTEPWGSLHDLYKFQMPGQLRSSWSVPVPSLSSSPALPAWHWHSWSSWSSHQDGKAGERVGQGQDKWPKKAKNLLHCLKFGVTYLCFAPPCILSELVLIFFVTYLFLNPHLSFPSFLLLIPKAWDNGDSDHMSLWPLVCKVFPL